MKKRIPSLDGLRAVSITFVILDHLFLDDLQSAPPLSRAALGLVCNGTLGVNIFFGISGFLITTLLVEEFDRTAGISLVGFYTRRAFRIFPAFYCYLLILLLLSVVDLVTTSPTCWISAAVYLRNYYPPFEGSGDFLTAHAWSLSIEEQFYLIWPACLALLGHLQGAWFAVGLIVLFPVSRLLTYVLLPSLRADIGYMTHTRGDALMVGCLAAMLINDPRFQRGLNRAFALRLPLIAIPFLLVASPLLRDRFGGFYQLTIGYTLEALAIVLVILWTIERPGTAVGWFLNTRPVAHVGVISYSLYLWQQMFAATFSWWSVPATFIAAEASYRFVERPVLSLRDRIARGQRVSVPPPVVVGDTGVDDLPHLETTAR